MEDKCFCHFNGFRVKDAEARKEIENIKTNYATKEQLNEIEVPEIKPIKTEGIFTCTDGLGEPLETASGTWSLTMIGNVGFCLFKVNVPANKTVLIRADIPNNPTLINGGANITYNDENKKYTFACQRLEGSVSEFSGFCTNKTSEEITNLSVQVIFGIE
jgi:hypothetical protein